MRYCGPRSFHISRYPCPRRSSSIRPAAVRSPFRSMTGSKHGVTIPPATAREVLTEPALVAKPIDDPAFVRPIALIRKRGRTLPRVAQAFVALMLRELK
ncbi:LysR substrate-binding domain-containing protein [Burkholderia ubonensis]|nr:LysR substrate-binding domain-containing protein [Burkholderia ubonensis]